MPVTTRDPEVASVADKRRKPRSPLWRLRVWQMLLLCGMGAIFCRLYYLQIMRGPELTKRATNQRQQNNLLIHRGAITDRHGLPLAIDTTRYDIYVHTDLLKVSDAEAIETFSRITHQDKAKLQKLFAAGYPIITLARHLGREEVDELQALNWTGVDIFPRSFRHYPEGKLAAHILGYVNMDTRGQGGVEQAEENSLENIGDMARPQLDGHGRQILVSDKRKSNTDITPPMGRHVELTIDNYLQHLAEKELSAMCYHSHAQKGSAIVADPQTGEVLAWANYPNYDPNEYTKYPYETTKNWSMVDVYQPGSTFKILTVSSGLDLGVIKPTSRFQDNGVLTIGNRSIHNHDGAHGNLDLLHLFIHSSNIASAQIGLLMTPKQFHDKLYEFGLGRKTGIELNGESAGLLLQARKWQPIDQATTGFGQGAMAMTPLQLVAAVGAVANNGTYIQPHLIRRVYDPRTGVTEKWTQPVKRDVIKPEVAHLVCNLLADNIEQGTQMAGKCPGYRVGGKTGTAQKTAVGGRGYIAGATIASFVGFLPADNPQLVCLVVVDSPQTDGRWGNTVAGPVFNAICVEAARYLGIPPAQGIDLSSKSKAAQAFFVPSVRYAAEIPSDKEPPRDPAGPR